MNKISFQKVQPEDKEIIQFIADWYWNEWKIPKEKTIEKLENITTGHSQFQILMKMNNTPIATGGLYHHVGLLDKEPRFKIYKNWLALVYTIPEKRHQGFGALICEHIQNLSKEIGVNQIHLFTDTAERLYRRLGWAEIERVDLGNRNVVIMRLDL